MRKYFAYAGIIVGAISFAYLINEGVKAEQVRLDRAFRDMRATTN